MWFAAAVTAINVPEQTCDLEYKIVHLFPTFGDDCDSAVLNLLLPDLAVSIEGLAVDLIDRSSREGGAHDDPRKAHLPDLISAKWDEPASSCRKKGLFGALILKLEQPILFHIVADASRLTLSGKRGLAWVGKIFGERTDVRLEADVELTSLILRFACRQDGIHFSVVNIEMELAHEGNVRFSSAEGGIVEWVVRESRGPS